MTFTELVHLSVPSFHHLESEEDDDPSVQGLENSAEFTQKPDACL